ncbi:MAG: DUF3263 domain-containing protein [Propioniciclava sp.]|uniref:DUF3263 domain-containing protein n=1 Tax=Propioniciclava sp. TaxID=2038686 RepID=UPI0039E500D8
MSEAMIQPEAGLSAADAAMLDFEARWWSASDSKDAEILARFGLSGPRYYQHLNALIDRPEALAYAPLLVKRMRRLRERRQRDRSARHLSVRSTV